MKYARNVHFQIKNGREKEFTTLFENEVLPVLKKQNGFREEMTLLGKRDNLAISVWDDRKSAETYESNTYPSVLKTLGPVIEGTPTVETYEVGNRAAVTA
jgi:heme-degrading monooxygenase HmoA